MKMFRCRMKDGSEFAMAEESWQKALELKYGKRAESSEFKKAFAETVADYWKRKKVPTKFEWDEDWDVYFKKKRREKPKEKQTFKNQAELASVVMYYLIRTPLFSVILKEIGAKETRVIGIGEEGFTVYNGKKKRTYEDLEDIEDVLKE